MSDERNEPDICESAHLALTMTQCASKSGFKPSRSKPLYVRYLAISFILLALFLTRFTKLLSGRAWRLKFRLDEFSKNFTTGKGKGKLCAPLSEMLGIRPFRATLNFEIWHNRAV
jgi:hypothetical protein